MRVEEFDLKKVLHRSFYKWSMDSEYTWVLVMILDDGKAVMKITCTTCILMTAITQKKNKEKNWTMEKKNHLSLNKKKNWSKIAEINQIR